MRFGNASTTVTGTGTHRRLVGNAGHGICGETNYVHCESSFSPRASIGSRFRCNQAGGLGTRDPRPLELHGLENTGDVGTHALRPSKIGIANSTGLCAARIPYRGESGPHRMRPPSAGRGATPVTGCFSSSLICQVHAGRKRSSFMRASTVLSSGSGGSGDCGADFELVARVTCRHAVGSTRLKALHLAGRQRERDP